MHLKREMFRLLWTELRASELHSARDVLNSVSVEAWKCPQSCTWSINQPGDARASSSVSVFNHFFLEACAFCVQKQCCTPWEIPSSPVVWPSPVSLPVLHGLCNAWCFQMHVCMNNGTSELVITTSLPSLPIGCVEETWRCCRVVPWN